MFKRFSSTKRKILLFKSVARFGFSVLGGFLLVAIVMGALTLLIDPDYAPSTSSSGKTGASLSDIRSPSNSSNVSADVLEELQKLSISKDADSFIINHWYEDFYYALFFLGVIASLLIFLLDRWLLGGRPSEPPPYFYQRARRYEKKANIVLGLIFLLIIGSSIVFFKAASFASDDAITLGVITAKLSQLANPNTGLRGDQSNGIEQPRKQQQQAQSQSGQLEPLSKPQQVQEQVKKQEAASGRVSQQSSDVPPAWLPLAFVLTLRVGDIAFTSFLTIMCLRIYRYNLRLSSFYFSRGDAIRLKGAKAFQSVDPELLPVLLDANFDFGTDVDPLSKHFADIINALNPRKSEEKDSNEGEAGPKQTSKDSEAVSTQINEKDTGAEANRPLRE